MKKTIFCLLLLFGCNLTQNIKMRSDANLIHNNKITRDCDFSIVGDIKDPSVLLAHDNVSVEIFYPEDIELMVKSDIDKISSAGDYLLSIRDNLIANRSNITNMIVSVTNTITNNLFITNKVTEIVYITVTNENSNTIIREVLVTRRR